jgi:hypothetical protein
MASQLCACGGWGKVKGERERFLILSPLPLKELSSLGELLALRASLCTAPT